MDRRHITKYFSVLILLFALLTVVNAAVTTSPAPKRKPAKAQVSESPRAQRRISHLHHSRPVAGRRYSRRSLARKHRYYEHFTANSFVDTPQTVGDITEGEDPVVRQAAITALGNMNGTVLAIDPASGRILTMVNQKLALSEGAQPCSTIKLSVALAALSERVITASTQVPIGGRTRMTLTKALAISNNAYFEALGRRLGFEKIKYYANQFGLGELAGFNIEGEHLGIYPEEELDGKLGGVGKMCSFGESVSMTPLQLGALVSAISNGGTLYYLQHPKSPEEVVNFQPKIKRTLDIAPYITEMSAGMLGATQFGTARSLRTSFSEQQVLGKTGTCSKDGTRFGWFASYANTSAGKIVTVVFLEGGRATFGPKAAELTGRMYRELYDHSFFAAKDTPAHESAIAVGASQ